MIALHCSILGSKRWRKCYCDGEVCCISRRAEVPVCTQRNKIKIGAYTVFTVPCTIGTMRKQSSKLWCYSITVSLYHSTLSRLL